MKQKSLRQLARELGVSASYLSQVKNGKRPASQKVLSSVKQSVKQNGIIFSEFTYGEVSELADEHDLGSCAERRGGSNPPFPTKLPTQITSQLPVSWRNHCWSIAVLTAPVPSWYHWLPLPCHNDLVDT